MPVVLAGGVPALAWAVGEAATRAARGEPVAPVLVWGVSANPTAVRLYESAGFRSRRVLREYRRVL